MEGIRKPNAAERKDNKQRFEAVVVETTELLEAQARDVGDHRMTESEEDRSKGWVSRTITRIWKHNLFQEYYRQKEINKAREEIVESGNLYVADGLTPEMHQKAMDAVMQRFTSEYEEDVLKDGERESKQVIEGQEVNEQIQGLVRTYAGSSMTPEAFQEERTRILSSLDPTYAAGNKSYADNLLKIATEVRSAVAHGAKLDEIDLDIRLTLGKAKESLRTEAKLHTFDRVMEKMQNSKIGRFVANEPTLVLGAAAAYSAAKSLGMSALRSSVGQWFTFGGTALAAGALSGLKESARTERERAQHIRERAKGMTFEQGSMPRREKMEESRYETKPAKAYINRLEQDLQNVKRPNASASDVEGAMLRLAELEARIRLGDKRRIDLISYTGAGEVEVERTQLDLLRARLKVALRESGKSFEEKHADTVDAAIGSLEGGDSGIEAKDRLFKKMKHGRVARAVVTTTLVGGTLGLVAQEVGSAFSSETDGLVEGAWKSIQNKDADLSRGASTLEGLRRFAFGDDPRIPLGVSHEVVIGNTSVVLPQTVNLVAGADGTYAITHSGVAVAEGLTLTFDADGDLSDESRDVLKEHGIGADYTNTVGSRTEQVELSAREFVEEHGEGMHQIRRELWFDNDTEAPNFDQNELRQWWGGPGNTGIDENGNYVFTVSNMTEGGSFHGAESVNAPGEVKDSGLKMIFSLSRDTQNYVFEVPIDAQGNAVIPPDSEIARLMFETENGRAVFTGQFAEVAQSTGVGEDGVEKVRILSTVVGEGRDRIGTDITVPTSEPVVRLDVPDSTDVLPPPFIPILARTALERASPGTSVMPEGVKPPEVALTYYYHGRPITQEERDEYKKMMTPELRDNPDADLNAQQEVSRYLEAQNVEYRDRLTRLVENVEPMRPECRAAVCIPVAAHQEEENIERTLSCYLNQTADPKSFEVVLFLNHPDTNENGQPILPDGTADRVAAFKKQHPELNIRVMSAVLPRSEARMGMIRKMLNDATVLRSKARNGEQDLVLISTDADTRGLAPEYVENFINKFDENPGTEAFMGQLDWDPEAYIRNPLVHIGTRFMQYMDVQFRREGRGIASSGANFAMRSSIYAAVGGYNTDVNLAEDVDLGRRITFARNNAQRHTPIAYAGEKVSRLYTSSRRAEKAVRDGLSPSEQWDRGFSAFDDEVRKTRWEDTGTPPDYDDPETVKLITQELERILNRTLGVTSSWYGEGDFDRRVARGLGWLGVKYEIVGKNTMRITDASRLIEGLKTYQKEGMEIMRRKTGQA